MHRTARFGLPRFDYCVVFADLIKESRAAFPPATKQNSPPLPCGLGFFNGGGALPLRLATAVTTRLHTVAADRELGGGVDVRQPLPWRVLTTVVPSWWTWLSS